MNQPASLLQLIGAGCFGALIGWYVYYINRHREGAVQFSDLVTLVGVIGGSAVLTLFPEQSDLFGAYGIGLALGFFAYLGMLLFIRRKADFPWAWFLDGRRPAVPKGMIALAPGQHPPMGTDLPNGPNPMAR